MPSPNATFEAKYKLWKERLLDLSARNRLLNFRETRVSSVPIVEPGPADIIRRLVEDERPFTFDMYEGKYIDQDGNERFSVIRGDICSSSSKTPPLLEKSLARLTQQATLAKEERGINTLYVAVGMLRWRPADQAEMQSAPLLLIPVTLFRENRLQPFKLNLFDDEPEINPTLKYMLRRDFEFALPELPDEIGVDSFRDFAEELERGVRARQWSVVPDVWLAQLHFKKLAMYRDLEEHEADAAPNSRLSAIAGAGYQPERVSIESDDSFDRIQPTEFFTAFDADASQVNVLLRARAGQSLIVQGPPGTGKSQTIANLITQAVHQGKKVLFVSEKMAALNIVSGRLKAAGLESLYLELHSDKASKRDVLARLKRAAYTPPVPQRDFAREFAALYRMRQQLNEYVRALHDRTRSLPSAFQLHAELAELSEVNGIPVSLPIDDFSEDDIDSKFQALRRLVDAGEEYLAGGVRPYELVELTRWSPALEADVRLALTEFARAVDALLRPCAAVAGAIGAETPCSIADAEMLLTCAEDLAKSPRPPMEWLTTESLDDLERDCIKASTQQSSLERALAGGMRVDADASTTPVAAAYAALTPDILEVLEDRVFETIRCQWCSVPSRAESPDPGRELVCRICGALLDGEPRRKARAKLEERAAGLVDSMTSYLSAANEARVGCERASTVVGFPNTGGSKALTFLSNLTAELSKLDHPLRSWLHGDSGSHVRTLAREAQVKFSELSRENAELSRCFESSVLGLPVDEILAHVDSFDSFWRRLLPSYRRLRKRLRQHQTETRVDHFELLDQLRRANAIRKVLNWIDERTPNLVSAFGRHFTGPSTDWSKIILQLDYISHLQHEYPGLFDHEECVSLASDGANGFAVFAEELRTAEARFAAAYKHVGGLLAGSDADSDFGVARCRVLLTKVESFQRQIMELRSQAKDSTLSSNDCVDFLGDVRSVQKLRANADAAYGVVASRLGRFAAGQRTDWNAIESAIRWCKSFKQHQIATQRVCETACDADRVRTAGGHISMLRTVLEDVRTPLSRLAELLATRSLVNPLRVTDFGDLLRWANEMLDSIPELQRWTAYRAARRECNERGLDELLVQCARSQTPAREIVRVFRKTLRLQQLDAAYARHPVLARFRKEEHERTIADFRELDSRLQDAYRKVVHASAAARRPDLQSGASGQIALLRKEFAKQRRHAPLRRLFKNAGNAVLQITPCLLMSPLSVATFLPKDSIEFDLAIFDEASQMPAEEAIGAVLRSKQLIVAGDTKQMPPSRFFERSVFDSDDWNDDEGDNEPLESVLEDCEAAGFESRRLQWHYRSRDESLISFSNSEFYENSLVTFPSVHESGESGVVFEYVPDGVYDRGRSRTNRVEARRVAQMVHAHLRSHGGRSLGVIALSIAQADAITQELDLLLDRHPDLDAALKANAESFFVKALENVQGDERDEIIISVGYGKDSNGTFALQLGPVSAEGGERRLNVAFTRARLRCTVVSSVRSIEIDERRSTRRGPLVLKRYLEFAETGRLPVETSLGSGETESPFETAVVRALEAAGVQTETQVGVSRYRIDIAVRDRRLPGRFLLGIECDGAMYHSSAVARDRDRLRQRALEDRGWRIYRIWSTEWVRDQKRIMTELLQLIHDLETEPSHTSEIPGAQPGPDVVDVSDDPKSDEDDWVEADPEDVAATNDPYTERLPLLSCYSETQLDERPRDTFYTVSDELLTSLLIMVVEQESPVHRDLVTARIARSFSLHRAKSTIRNRVNTAIDRAAYRKRVVVRGEFLWRLGDTGVVPRRPAEGEAVRRIEHVALEEIAEAALLVARQSIAITKAELVRETARTLGYQRTGANIEERLNAAVAAVEADGRLRRQGEFLRTSE